MTAVTDNPKRYSIEEYLELEERARHKLLAVLKKHGIQHG